MLITPFIIYKQQFLHSDWLRTRKFIPNSSENKIAGAKLEISSAKRENGEIENDWQLRHLQAKFSNKRNGGQNDTRFELTK